MKKYKIYLDQSCASNLIEQRGTNFSPLYYHLLELQKGKKIEIWASPHNACELVIWNNYDRRQAVSLALENLSEGRRMLTSYEFVILKEFLDFIDQIWPQSNVNHDYFHYLAASNQRTYSGLIAHLAAYKEYDASKGAEIIVKTKKLSKLRQLILLNNAKESINILVENPSEAINTESKFDDEYN